MVGDETYIYIFIRNVSNKTFLMIKKKINT